MSKRTQVTVEQAKKFIEHNDAYGTTRLYGVIADGMYAGQIKGIKSLAILERATYSELYTVGTDISDLIGRA